MRGAALLLLLGSLASAHGGAWDDVFESGDLEGMLQQEDISAKVDAALLSCSKHRMSLRKPVHACDRVRFAEELLRHRRAFEAAAQAASISTAASPPAAPITRLHAPSFQEFFVQHALAGVPAVLGLGELTRGVPGGAPELGGGLSGGGGGTATLAVAAVGADGEAAVEAAVAVAEVVAAAAPEPRRPPSGRHAPPRCHSPPSHS